MRLFKSKKIVLEFSQNNKLKKKKITKRTYTTK